MLAAIAAIADNTVREALRSRVLYTLVFFAIALIGSGVLLSGLSYVERERILQDFGLESIRIFGTAIAIFVGVGLIHREVERRTVYTILSKPVARGAFVLGKFAGLTLTVWVLLALMALAFGLVSLLAGAPLDAGHAWALLLVGAELSLLVAVATLFSSFTTPLLATCFTLGCYVIGHSVRDLRALGAVSESPVTQKVTAGLYWLLPDLDAFNLVIPAVHGLPISAAQVWMPLLFGLAYSGLLLFAAVWIFERRDLR